MRFNEYVAYAEEYRLAHPQQRKGQAYFNALHHFDPVISQHLWSSTVDCFHQDEKLDDFLTEVAARMGE